MDTPDNVLEYSNCSNPRVNCHQLIKNLKETEISVVVVSQQLVADRGPYRDRPRKLPCNNFRVRYPRCVHK